MGEMSLLESTARSASIRVISEEAFLIEISETHFGELMSSNPKVLLAMLKILSGRLRRNIDTMASERQRLNIFTHDIRNCLVPLQAAELYLDDIVKSMLGTDP